MLLITYRPYNPCAVLSQPSANSKHALEFIFHLRSLGKPASMFPVSVYSEVTQQLLSIQQFCPVHILSSK